jgi:hypothetical protein
MSLRVSLGSSLPQGDTFRNHGGHQMESTGELGKIPEETSASASKSGRIDGESVCACVRACVRACHISKVADFMRFRM